MAFCLNTTIYVKPTLKKCSNKTGCFSTLLGHTVNFVGPRLKFVCLCQKFDSTPILSQNLQIRHMRSKC